jgi:hypothetical protein
MLYSLPFPGDPLSPIRGASSEIIGLLLEYEQLPILLKASFLLGVLHLEA